jgi:7-alpha-hydroxysteroid dehydrogenase
MDVFDSFRLDGKVAIVTGAGKGIGAGVALTLAQAGADVAISARTKSDLDGVAEQIRAAGRRALVHPADVMNYAELGTLVDATVAEFGGLDIVVNNAGGSNAKAFSLTTVEDLEWCFKFNVSTAFEMTRLAVPHMLARGGGSIVNITSVSGHKAVRGSVTYATAKGAMSHMTRNIAADLAPKIRVNAVAPGAIETDSLAGWLDQFGEVREQMIERTYMRRNGRVSDIALACLYLASPASAWVTGKILEVDGMAQHELIDKNIPDL